MGHGDSSNGEAAADGRYNKEPGFAPKYAGEQQAANPGYRLDLVGDIGNGRSVYSTASRGYVFDFGTPVYAAAGLKELAEAKTSSENVYTGLVGFGPKEGIEGEYSISPLIEWKDYNPVAEPPVNAGDYFKDPMPYARFNFSRANLGPGLYGVTMFMGGSQAMVVTTTVSDTHAIEVAVHEFQHLFNHSNSWEEEYRNRTRTQLELSRMGRPVLMHNGAMGR